MATTTQGGTTGNNKRRFQIGRKNGEKTGEPVFLEWLRELPAEENRAGRRFETRGEGKRHYETFSAVDGILTGFRVENRVIVDEERTFLYVTLDDGTDAFDIEVGDVDGRYSLNLMQRLCATDFDPTKTTRLSPYAFTADNGKTYIGVSVYNGPDKVESRKEDETFKPAKAITTDFKGKTMYDFTPVATWYVDYMKKNLVPKLPENAWNISGPTTAPAATGRTPNAKDAPVPADVANDPNFPSLDDLPF